MRTALGPVVDVLATHHGVISLEQLAAMHVTRAQLRTAVRNGWLVKVAPTVYGSTSAPRTPEFGRFLGLLALGPDAVVSHRGAAALHQFDRFPADAVEFTVPRRARGVKLPYIVHSTTTLPRIDRVRVASCACTSATRTIIDLARQRLAPALVEAAIDTAVRRGLSSPEALGRRLAELRGPGRWGARLLDQLLLDSGGHTVLERRFLQLVRRAGLPRPRTQVVHRRDGRTFARVDFLFDEAGVVIEVSGRKGHSSPSERARDAQRRNELQDIGRRVYEYTWEQVTQRADWVIETLRSRLLRS